jgi:hypothetical protein
VPVENKSAMSSAISRFMGAPPRRVSVTATQPILSSSTSKISVAPGGMTPPAPRSP